MRFYRIEKNDWDVLLRLSGDPLRFVEIPFHEVFLWDSRTYMGCDEISEDRYNFKKLYLSFFFNSILLIDFYIFYDIWYFTLKKLTQLVNCICRDTFPVFYGIIGRTRKPAF